MAVRTEQTTESAIQWLTDDEARRIFDEQARKLVGMSGTEFIRRWEAGEFDAIADDPGHPEIMQLVMLISFGR